MSLTPQTVFEDRIAARLQSDPASAQSVNALYLFDIAGSNGGQWPLDLTVPEVRSGGADDANVTVRMTEEDFIDMVEGRLQGPAAFMTGKLKIEGDLSLAMKLGQVLDVREG